MKHNLGWVVVLLGLWVGCQSTPTAPVEGRWKVDRVSFGGKDISKSSDPAQKNGLQFYKDGSYAQFGYPNFQDSGRYRLNGDQLLLHSQKEGSDLQGRVRHRNDTLYLSFPMEGDRALNMRLHRWE